MKKLPFGFIQIDFPEGTKEFVTLLDMERLSEGDGIPSEGLIGAVLRPRERPSDPIAPDNFAANAVFINFMQRIIAREGPNTEQLVVNAGSLGEGILYVVDGRVPAPRRKVREWKVPSEDILGEFDVKAGEIVPGSYRANPQHRLLSSKGFFQLEEELAELESVPDPGDGPEEEGSRWDFIN